MPIYSFDIWKIEMLSDGQCMVSCAVGNSRDSAWNELL